MYRLLYFILKEAIQMYKRILSFTMVFLVTMGTLFVVTASTQSIEEMTEFEQMQAEMETMEAFVDSEFGEGFFQNQQYALEIADQMINMFPRNRSGDIMYPEFYGGAYIGDDGRFVVLIVESMDDTAARSEVFSSTLSNNINYRNVEFSYSDLTGTKDIIFEIQAERNNLNCVYARNVTSLRVGIRANRIIVGLEIYNDEKKAGYMENIFNSPMILFEQGVRIVEMVPTSDYSFRYLEHEYCKYYVCYCEFDYSNNEEQEETGGHIEVTPFNDTTINPGDMLFYRFFNQRPTGTMGFRVRRVNDHATGFVTSGHIWNFEGQRAYTGGWFARHIGTVTNKSVNSSLMDASVVITNDRGTPSNNTPMGTLRTDVTGLRYDEFGRRVGFRDFWEGQTVVMFGATSASLGFPSSIGRITYVGVNVPDIGRIQMVRTDIHVRPGDSGGTIATATLQTAGIVLAGPYNHGQGGRPMYFVPAFRIIDTMHPRLERF